MPYDPQKHHRRSIRIQGIDYSQAAAYFVTCVSENRICVFSRIINGAVSLELPGKAVQDVWNELPRHYPNVSLGDMVIMPNHIHAILFLNDNNGKSNHGLPEIIRALKSYSARRINILRSTSGVVWQRNYFEHIVRDNEELRRIIEYIQTNPNQWDLDQENPSKRAGHGQILV